MEVNQLQCHLFLLQNVNVALLTILLIQISLLNHLFLQFVRTSAISSEPCAYNVTIPPPWSIITIFPYPAVEYVDDITIPSFAAIIFVPVGQAISVPEWFLTTFNIG